MKSVADRDGRSSNGHESHFTAAPPQHRRWSSVSCDRHPEEEFTGFCSSCLFERLTSLDKLADAPSSSSSAAVKALFSSNSDADFKELPKPPISAGRLRRTKSVSDSKNETFEPERKYCDFRGRGTLSSLFNDEDNNLASSPRENCPNFGYSVRNKPNFQNSIGFNCRGDEIRAIADAHLEDFTISEEILEDDPVGVKRNSGGGIWAMAASVFSKKWQKRRHNHKPISHLHYTETQSEAADYASCDMDPKFFFEEPRASCDGYMMKISSGRMAPISPPTEHAGKYRSYSYSGAATMVADINELKTKSKAKVSPTSADYFHGAKELRDNSHGANKQSRKWWSWRILGGGGDTYESKSTPNVVNRNMLGSKSSARPSTKHSHLYSPSQFDNGLLRFYLAPMRSSRRGGVGKMKQPNSSQSIARTRSVLKQY